METIGVLGAIILFCSSIPQVFDSIKNGHSNGINKWMLVLWFIGSVLT